VACLRCRHPTPEASHATRSLIPCRPAPEGLRRPDTASRLLDAFKDPAERAAAAGAGWHGADDITTLAGLAGEFLWSENPLQPMRMSFTFDAGHAGSQGRYHLTRVIGTPEEGTFHCVPNNPAIGWAFISLLPKPGTPRTFIVDGMFTDASGRIVILLLNKTDAQGPVQPPFAAQRIL
jgi:hypothetical protein